MAAVNINLLPIDLSAKSQAARFGNILRKITTAIIGIFSVLVVLAGVFIVVLSLQLDSVNKKNELLKQNIAALETTEQKTVFVKDRLQKIKGLGEGSKTITSMALLGGLLPSLPPPVSLSESTADSTGALDFSFKVSDSASLPPFLALLITNEGLSKLSIKNLSFNPASGYIVSLEAAIK